MGGLGGGGAPLCDLLPFRSTNTSARAAWNCSPGPGQDRARSTPGRWRRERGGTGVGGQGQRPRGTAHSVPATAGPGSVLQPASWGPSPSQCFLTRHLRRPAPQTRAQPVFWSHIVVILTGTCPAPPLPAERFQEGPEELRKRASVLPTPCAGEVSDAGTRCAPEGRPGRTEGGFTCRVSILQLVSFYSPLLHRFKSRLAPALATPAWPAHATPIWVRHAHVPAQVTPRQVSPAHSPRYSHWARPGHAPVLP